jgi:predicted deacetylase
MPVADSAGKALAVVLHDVAPQTWPCYREFVAQLDTFGRVPLTLLVVPDFHHRGVLARDRDFCATIDARLARGDEVALHGYYHSDEQALGFNPRAWFMRRVYTHEGEFSALAQTEACARIERGLELFARLDWPVAGFVAPAWLMNRVTRHALGDFPFQYTSSPATLIRLPQWQPLPAPSLVWSARSAWRRRVSQLWNERRLRRCRGATLLRLGLHPVDMQHAAARGFWWRTIKDLLTERRALTKQQWLEDSA